MAVSALCADGRQDGPRDWRRFVLGTRPAADADDDSDAEPQQQQPRLVADVPAFLARSQDAVLATGTLLFPKNYIAQCWFHPGKDTHHFLE